MNGNLSRIERNSANPSLDLLYRLAQSLEISVTELFQVAEGGLTSIDHASLNHNFMQLAPEDRILLVEFSNLLHKMKCNP